MENADLEFKEIAVIGSGTMGCQIAMKISQYPYRVVCYDINALAIKKAEDFFESWIEKALSKGKISAAQGDTMRKNLSFTTDLKEAVGSADFVMEAVLDEVAVKKKIFKEISQWAPEHCIYGSNSSYIVSSKFADSVKKPSHLLNVHFFNPALIMEVVEVVKGPHVSDEVFQRVINFVESIGKTPVKVDKEIYGFIVNRIFSALTREACHLVDMEIATPEEIDKAVKGALGHAMGPLETLDMTGIDLEYSVYMDKFKQTGLKTDLPATCLTKRYALGQYGRKTGKGFYTYETYEKRNKK